MNINTFLALHFILLPFRHFVEKLMVARLVNKFSELREPERALRVDRVPPLYCNLSSDESIPLFSHPVP
jgi:hypothetical protein